MSISTGYMYCTYNGQQQQQKLRGNGIYVIAYFLPWFVVKLFVMCDLSCELIITCENAQQNVPNLASVLTLLYSLRLPEITFTFFLHFLINK